MSQYKLSLSAGSKSGRHLLTRSSQTQSDHDWMVQQMAEAYAMLGHEDVKANYGGYDGAEPSRLGLHVPDVTALAGLLHIPIICDVETSDDLRNERTRKRLLTFRSAADTIGGVLHVGVPLKSDLHAAKRTVAAWGILVDQWWYGVAL